MTDGCTHEHSAMRGVLLSVHYILMHVVPLWSLVYVLKLIVLKVGRVDKGVPTQGLVGSTVRMILVGHRGVDDVLWLPVGDTLILPGLDDAYQIAEDGQGGSDSGDIVRHVLGAEEEGPDNIADGGTAVVEGHDSRLLGLTGRVDDYPRDDEWVATKEEGEQVVAGESDRLAEGGGGAFDVKLGETDDDKDHGCNQDGALVFPPGGSVGCHEDRDNCRKPKGMFSKEVR
jgi:hypothetical protein